MVEPEKRREILYDFSLGVIIPAIVTFIILLPLYLRPGYIFHGDAGWYLYASIPVYLKLIIFTWHQGPLASNGLFFLALQLPLLIFGSYFANHAWVFLLAFLPGVTSYFCIKKTLELIYGPSKNVLRYVSTVVGSVFYLINWQNYGLIEPTISWAPSYIILPILTYLLIKIYKERRMQDILIFALVSMLGDTVPDWIVFSFIEIIVVLIVVLIFNISKVNKFSRYLLTTFYLVVATILANAYMLVEIIGGFLSGVGGTFAAYGAPSSEILAAKNESFFHLVDVLMFGQPNFYSFGLNPKNWTSLNVTIIMSAIVIFVYIVMSSVKHKRFRISFTSPIPYSIYFFLLIMISLFLSKGFNPPLGFLYKYVILLSPPGIVGITLDVGPWFILAALSYSFLFSIGLYYAFFEIVYEPPVEKKQKVLKTKMKSLNYFNGDYFLRSATVVVVVILLGGAIASAMGTTYTKLESSTYPDYSPLYFPEPYIEVTDYIKYSNSSAYVTWIPYNGAYSWERNYSIYNLLSDLGGDLSENFVNPQYLYPYLENNTTDLANLLTVGNIKYLIIDQSGVSPVKMSFQNLMRLIERQSDIKLVYQYSWLTVFKNEENFSVIQAEDYSNMTIGNSSILEGNNLHVPHISAIREVSPVQYTFNYYSTKTSLILFHKVYSNLWVLTLNGVQYRPIPLYNGSEMGFNVEQGYGHVTLYYELQNYFYIGAGITIIFAVASIWYIHKRNNLRRRRG